MRTSLDGYPKETRVQELESLLAASSAAEQFKKDVVQFHRAGEAGRIATKGYVPPVKVSRLLKQLLSAEPALPIERVSLLAFSGCSDFVGKVEVHTSDGRHTIEFVWDCRWRAETEGWVDYFGLPDQIRAAREFDWRCFKTWRSISN